MSTLIDSDSVNISVNDAGNQIVVGVLGVQGPAGGGGDSSFNPIGFITTGDSDARYYPLNSNPNGYLTSAGTGNYLPFSSGDLFYLKSNPSGYITSASLNGFVSSGNLESTGTLLQNQITNIRNDTGNFINASNLNGFAKSGDIVNASGSLSDSINETGSYLFGLINASSAGVSSLNGVSGAVTVNGSNGINIGTNSNTITISGQPYSTGLIQLDSVSSLRAVNTGIIAPNTVAIVRSYYNDSEPFATAIALRNKKFGGGKFYWNPSLTNADDSGLYIRPNSVASDSTAGRWERLFAGEIPTPQMWGAKGDAYPISNATSGNYVIPGNDDTIPIQNAINACSFSNNGVLRFPSAFYKITDTLVWYTQQTMLMGDGVTNNSTIIMDIGIEKDMIHTSTYHNYVYSHNESPTSGGLTSLQNASIIPFDQFILKNLSLRYGGNSHGGGGASYAAYPQYRQATGVSCFTVTQPGECNQISDCMLFGGKHAVRVVGVGAPGLRVHNVMVGANDSNYSIEPIIYRTTGGLGGFSGAGGETYWATGAGTVATVYLTSNSSDNRGINSGAFAFLKVQNGAAPKIFIENLKLEGYFTSGVVNFQKPYGNSIENAYMGAIQINGMTWNGDNATSLPQNGQYDQNVVVLHGAKQATSQYRGVDVSIKDANLYGVKNIIYDSIAKGGTGNAFTYETPIGEGFSQQNLFPEINYNSQWLYSGSNGNQYSSVGLKKNGKYFVHIYPTQIGWYRIARGLGNGPVNVLNHDFVIGQTYKGLNKVRANSYGQRYGVSNLSLSSESSFVAPTSTYVSRARLITETTEGAINQFLPVYFDIYVNSLPGSSTSERHIEISCETNGLEVNLPSPFISPFYLGSGASSEFYRKKLATSVEFYNYAEVDLTKPVDKSYTDSETLKYGNNLLVGKDVHLFSDANGEVKIFDAGATVTFSGGGYSTQAQGQPVFSDGKLKHIVLTNTGAGYSSPPTIFITPRTLGNGSGAFASGSISNGISLITIISGGDGYGRAPLSHASGYSFLRSTSSGEFYKSTNPNNFISSGDVNSISGGLQQSINNSGGYLYGLIASATGINFSGYITTGNSDNRYVDRSTNQLITGNKTFIGNITAAAATIPQIYSPSNNGVVDVANGYLIEPLDALISVSWLDRILYDDAEATSLNWNTRTLSSTWSADGFSVGGNSVVTSNQTGQFYPASNPQAYLRSGESVVPISHNFFIDYPFSGLNVVESYIQDNFVITGCAVGVNVTGNSGPMGINVYQRLTNGTDKISLFNESFGTGIYHQINSKSNLMATGNNRFVIDITGIITGYRGLTVGLWGYK